MTKGIDVSKWQGEIDFEKVKADGIDFVIIRAGFGRELSQKDPYFETYYEGAKATGLNVGAYWYSYAESAEDAITEAETCLKAIEGKKFEFPIYFDLEEKSQFEKGLAFCDSLVESFCRTLEEAGYYAGLYCSTYWLSNYISPEIARKYTLWVAEYANECSYRTAEPQIWQYTGKGKVDGVNGDVDLDVCYKDFPQVIKDNHLNGFYVDPFGNAS